MLPADLLEHDPSRTRAPVGYIVETLTDRLEYISVSGKIQQVLIGSRVLHDGLALPLTVRTTGRLLFWSRFIIWPDRRRNVVSD